MIPGSETYPFLPTNPAAGPLGLMPLLPLRLELPPHSLAVLGLLDTASAVNVLPYDVGLQLGAIWNQQTTAVQLTGNLASVPARGPARRQPGRLRSTHPRPRKHKIGTEDVETAVVRGML